MGAHRDPPLPTEQHGGNFSFHLARRLQSLKNSSQRKLKQLPIPDSDSSQYGSEGVLRHLLWGPLNNNQTPFSGKEIHIKSQNLSDTSIRRNLPFSNFRSNNILTNIKIPPASQSDTLNSRVSSPKNFDQNATLLMNKNGRLRFPPVRSEFKIKDGDGLQNKHTSKGKDFFVPIGPAKEFSRNKIFYPRILHGPTKRKIRSTWKTVSRGLACICMFQHL